MIKVLDRLYICVILFSLLFSSLGWGETDILSAFEIEGANFTYDIDTGKIVSEGDLILKSKDFSIKTKNVMFDTKNQILQGKDGIELDIKNTLIKAEEFEIDFKKGIAELSKKVEFQGMEEKKNWKIEGEEFLVKFIFSEEKREIDEIYGKKGGTFSYGELTGKANNIRYIPLKNKIYLSQEVKITKGKNTMIAESIIVDLSSNKIFTKGKVKIIVNK